MRNGEVNVFCCFKSRKTNNELSMGNTAITASNKGESPPSVDLPRTHNARLSMRTRLPMPDQNELERRFTKVLVSHTQPYFSVGAIRCTSAAKWWQLVGATLCACSSKQTKAEVIAGGASTSRDETWFEE